MYVAEDQAFTHLHVAFPKFPRQRLQWGNKQTKANRPFDILTYPFCYHLDTATETSNNVTAHRDTMKYEYHKTTWYVMFHENERKS